LLDGDEHSAEAVRVSATLNVARPPQDGCAVEKVHYGFVSMTRNVYFVTSNTPWSNAMRNSCGELCVAWLFNNTDFADKDTESVEQRIVIKFLVGENVPSAEIHHRLTPTV